jgi:high affinity Mn2+ porin
MGTGMRGLLAGSAVLLGLILPCRAEEASEAPSSKASTFEKFDWSGAYVGAQVGYSAGSSSWSATQPGGPDLTGSIDLFHAFNVFDGSGSYYGGFEAGYNYVLPSHLMLGIEGDLSFPNKISGSQTVSSDVSGQASNADTVLMLGTARGRIGYAFDKWLVYGTGGFALSRDQLDRTQLSGSAGSAIAGDVDTELLTRFGVTVGAGIEVGLTPKLSAKLEYQFLDFPSGGVFFPIAGQHYDSDLILHNVELGLNYKLGDTGDDPAESDEEQSEAKNWAIHGQTTYSHVYDPPFLSPYVGPQSLVPNQAREIWDATLYVGFRLWQGAELWVDPEINQGFGLSDTHGIAAFPTGEAFREGAAFPYTRLLQAAFVRQTIDLGGKTEEIEADANRFGGSQTADRLVFTIGRFAVQDIFDKNKYANEEKEDFSNWALINTGSFDYAADSWDYTYGTAVEWYTGPWTLRGGFFDLSILPDNPELDPSFAQFQLDGEIERRYDLWQQPGKIAITGFLSRARFGRYADAIRLSEETGQPPDLAAVANYTSRGGVSFNLEQQIMPNVGFFMRAGLASGDVGPWDFTDIDRTVAAGLSFSGKRWGRPGDTWGIGGVVNGITKIHEQFLNDGGLGLIIGDGKLPHPGPEEVVETYYSLQLAKDCWFSPDYQFVIDPGYNRDRGPVSVIGARLHAEF